MIKSWGAYALSAAAIIILGFVKVKVPLYPIETVVTGIVTITIGYLTKRVVQRGRMFTNNEQNKKMNMKGGLSED